MLKKAISFCFAVFILISPCAAFSAKSYALVEQKTGRLLTEGNAEERLPMASTTKIMTGLLACESGKLDKTFSVPEEAIHVEGSSVGLLPGEKITLRALTYGLLLESGNDAANTIAYLLSGSIDAFAKKMNERAAELQLRHTHFCNPSGLDNKQHYTTASDLARLGAWAMSNKDFRTIASTRKIRVTYNGIKDGRALYNHNALLRSYPGAIGIKTGFTKKSGRCLVSCASRGGVTVVCATLKDPRDWADSAALLDYGFKILKNERLFVACPQCQNPPEIAVPVRGGIKGRVCCRYNREISAALRPSERAQVSMQVALPKSVRAPVKEGQKLGEVIFKLGKTELTKTDVLADETVTARFNPPKRFPLWDFFNGLLKNRHRQH